MERELLIDINSIWAFRLFLPMADWKFSIWNDKMRIKSQGTEGKKQLWFVFAPIKLFEFHYLSGLFS